MGEGFTAYRLSRTALNAFTLHLGKTYPELISVAMHPGRVKTDMVNKESSRYPSEAAETAVWLAHRGFDPEPFFVDLMQCVRDYCRINLLFPYVYSTEELSSIRIPTFLIIGSKEVLCNFKRSIKNAKSKFENIDIYIIDKTGHTPNMENPDEFNKIVTSILSQKK